MKKINFAIPQAGDKILLKYSLHRNNIQIGWDSGNKWKKSWLFSILAVDQTYFYIDLENTPFANTNFAINKPGMGIVADIPIDDLRKTSAILYPKKQECSHCLKNISR